MFYCYGNNLGRSQGGHNGEVIVLLYYTHNGEVIILLYYTHNGEVIVLLYYTP